MKGEMIGIMMGIGSAITIFIVLIVQNINDRREQRKHRRHIDEIKAKMYASISIEPRGPKDE